MAERKGCDTACDTGCDTGCDTKPEQPQEDKKEEDQPEDKPEPQEEEPPLSVDEIERRRRFVRDVLLERARKDWEQRVEADGARYRRENPEMREMLDKTQAKLVLEGSDQRTREPTDLKTVVTAFNFAHAKAIEYLQRYPNTTDASTDDVRRYVLDGNENLQKFAKDHPRGFELLVTPSFVRSPAQIEMMRNLIVNQIMN